MSDFAYNPNSLNTYEEAYVRKNEYLKLLASVKTLEQKVTTLEEMLIMTDGSNLQYIENQTDALCNLAIEKDPMNLMFVHHKTKHLCRKAIKMNPMSIQFCPHKDMYEEAIRLNGLSLMVIPDEDKTPHLCLLAVNQNPDAAFYVPTKKDYLQAWRFGIYHNPWLIGHLSPDDEIYHDLKQYAFDRDPMVYEVIQNPTEEMTIKYIKECPTDDWLSCKGYVPNEHMHFKVIACMLLKSMKFWYRK
mgnify:CR=1 FL=1